MCLVQYAAIKTFFSGEEMCVYFSMTFSIRYFLYIILGEVVAVCGVHLGPCQVRLCIVSHTGFKSRQIWIVFAAILLLLNELPYACSIAYPRRTAAKTEDHTFI